MKSRLVLGAATFGRLTQIEVNRLLGTAMDLGIHLIDTANGYEGSEERIGCFLGKSNHFVVNTKVGLPDTSKFTPAGIKLSVEESLKRLGVERIGTLFVHSLDASHLTEENIGAMVSLKEQGKVEKIGYAGDGVNLGYAIQTMEFDDFAMTFNIIDQANAKEIRQIASGGGVYFKLALGQAIWTSQNLDSRVKSNKFIRFLFSKPPVPASWVDYRVRFKELKSEIDAKNYANTFLGFALFSGQGNQYVILGTSSIRHIHQAVRFESDALIRETFDARRYEDLWVRKAPSSWDAHVG